MADDNKLGDPAMALLGKETNLPLPSCKPFPFLDSDRV
jgi:hypothetical protein